MQLGLALIITAFRYFASIILRIINLGSCYGWSSDGYDKLKPYGFPIHGAIDGFSRKIIWLKVTRTNNNPVVPAYLYINSVLELNKIPDLLLTDRGTETGLMAGIHCTLHQDVHAHRFVKSVSNQRIENWWSRLRKQYTSWVMNFFKQMIDDGHFSLCNHVHKECAWFVFKDLIQADLDEIKLQWNTHYIRRSKEHTIPGIPEELFLLPERYGFRECGMFVNKDAIETVTGSMDMYKDGESAMKRSDPNLVSYFEYIVNFERLQYPPLNWKDAQVMFMTIIEHAM